MSSAQDKQGQSSEAGERARRLAQALRENLHRRKAQARAQAASGAGAGPEETGPQEDDPPRSR